MQLSSSKMVMVMVNLTTVSDWVSGWRHLRSYYDRRQCWWWWWWWWWTQWVTEWVVEDIFGHLTLALLKYLSAADISMVAPIYYSLMEVWIAWWICDKDQFVSEISYILICMYPLWCLNYSLCKDMTFVWWLSVCGHEFLLSNSFCRVLIKDLPNSGWIFTNSSSMSNFHWYNSRLLTVFGQEFLLSARQFCPPPSPVVWSRPFATPASYLLNKYKNEYNEYLAHTSLGFSRHPHFCQPTARGKGKKMVCC